MNWLKLLSLIPVIASGINTIHADLDVNGKVSAAQDALGLATEAAEAVSPTAVQPFETAAASLVSNTLTQVVTLLHHQTAAPAPAPSSPAPAN